MNDSRNKTHPSVRVGIFIVVIVLLVIATLLYNAITEKREYDRETAASDAPVAQAASAAAAASSSHGAQ
jgi:hypothetical protein